MNPLAAQRRFFAEEIQTLSNLTTPALVDALATVPRERFLPPGPWTIRSEADYVSGARRTRDDDPRRIYHNVSVAIDSDRHLFNGTPSLLALCIDSLNIRPADRVLHVGCGLGYYTALIAECVGTSGEVMAFEIDEALAAAASRNLADVAQVKVTCGNGRLSGGERFDSILINAGVTHPEDAWLDALPLEGRLVLSLTATMPAMGPIGKGPLLLLTRRETDFAAKIITRVAIYSALGIRDATLNQQLGRTLMQGRPPVLRRLRRDRHEPSPDCWLHAARFCVSA